MPLDVVWTDAAIKNPRRLDRQVAERIRVAVRRYAATGQGDLKQFQDSGGPLRLGVGDWRVRFRIDFDPASTATFRILPRGRACGG